MNNYFDVSNFRRGWISLVEERYGHRHHFLFLIALLIFFLKTTTYKDEYGPNKKYRKKQNKDEIAKNVVEKKNTWVRLESIQVFNRHFRTMCAFITDKPYLIIQKFIIFLV